MDKYKVKMLPRASRDLDNIYNHIADNFKEIGTAEKMADSLEAAILSLDEMPYPVSYTHLTLPTIVGV